MTYSYNILDEAWIPCILLDGRQQYFSTRTILQSATDIHRISAEFAPMTASILHFLLAVLYSSLAIQDEDEWERLWQLGVFELDRIESYLQNWQHRFDLFDRDHPFYQDIQIGSRSKDIVNLKGKTLQVKTVNDIILHVATGSSATLFDHHTDEVITSFSPKQMVPLLLMVQGFSLGGMNATCIPVEKFFADTPHARGAVFFLQGKNLFETLMLNLIASSHLEGLDDKNDQPAWEMEDAFTPDRKKPRGIKDFLTWQSRRMLLLPDDSNGNGCCEKIYICPGLSLAEEFENPFYSIYYIEAKKGELQKKMVRFSQNKALWRDSQVLLEASGTRQKRFRALDWVNNLLMIGCYNGHINFSAYGLCTEPGKKKAFFYREEILSFPAGYLNDALLRGELFRCIKQVDDVKKQLWGAMSVLVEKFLCPDYDDTKNRKPDPSARDALLNHVDAEQLFWNGLELHFQSLLFGLPNDAEKAVTNWNESTQKAAWEALDHAIQALGVSTPALMAGAAASRVLRFGLKKFFEATD